MGVIITCQPGNNNKHSRGSGDIDLISRQCIRMGAALAAMFVVAQIPPNYLRLWAPALFRVGLVWEQALAESTLRPYLTAGVSHLVFNSAAGNLDQEDWRQLLVLAWLRVISLFFSRIDSNLK